MHLVSRTVVEFDDSEIREAITWYAARAHGLVLRPEMIHLLNVDGRLFVAATVTDMPQEVKCEG